MDEDTAALVDLLRTSRRPAMRLEIARQLADKRIPDLAPVLLELLETSYSPASTPVITVALSGLQALGPSIAPAIIAVMDADRDPRRPFMPLLLASSLGERAAPRLIEALDDTNDEVALNAATQLGQLRVRSAFEPLLGVVRDKHAAPALRGAAAAALGALRDARALPILAELSTSTVPELLAGAIDGLADLRDPKGASYLEAILDRPDLDETLNRAVRLGLLAMEKYRERLPPAESGS